MTRQPLLLPIAMMLLLLVVASSIVVTTVATADLDDEQQQQSPQQQTEDEKRRSIRLKTTGQLKKIFAELGINYQETMSKAQLQELAYETDAVEQWLQRHPEKRRRRPRGGDGKFGQKPPDGMNEEQWERLLRQLHGDKDRPQFDHIQDPERRRILERLSQAGLHMPNSEDMEMEQLRNLAKILDDIPKMATNNDGAQQQDTSDGNHNVDDEGETQEL